MLFAWLKNGDHGAVFGSLDLSPSMSMSQNLLSPGSHHHVPLPCPHSRGHSLGALSFAPSTAPNSRGGSIASTCGGKEQTLQEEDPPLVGPPASSLTRRPALVPPKLIPDPDYENETTDRLTG
jgi:hypothetical protein